MATANTVQKSERRIRAGGQMLPGLPTWQLNDQTVVVNHQTEVSVTFHVTFIAYLTVTSLAQIMPFAMACWTDRKLNNRVSKTIHTSLENWLVFDDQLAVLCLRHSHNNSIRFGLSVRYLEIMAPCEGPYFCQLECPSICTRLCIVSLKASINYFAIVSLVLPSYSINRSHSSDNSFL
jgi:hypothetical protein